MRVSTKGLYGTLAVLDLAVHYAGGHVHKADIAARQGIPEQYLAQLLAVLRRAGYVTSVRGPAGGHALAKAPEDITVGEVIELLDGPQVHDAPETGPTGKIVVQEILQEANKAAADILYDASFDIVLERWRNAEGALDFVI
jgi:Rrf2 family protein